MDDLMKSLRSGGTKDKRLLLIVVIFIIIIFGVFRSYQNKIDESGAGYVVIEIGGHEFDRYSLDQDVEKQIIADNGTNYLIINDGVAYIWEADCEDQECVNSPSIAEDGEEILCTTHNLRVAIVGGSNEE